ncbi:hypothetical protein KUF71_023089, partial [Frankliniella fusca]
MGPALAEPSRMGGVEPAGQWPAVSEAEAGAGAQDDCLPCPSCPAEGCVPECQHRSAPPVPLPTYRWELVRRDKEACVYPWTHVLKPPLRDPPD